MTSERMHRERQVWIAAFAVLITGAAWLALINAALLLRTFAPQFDALIVAARVLVGVLPIILSVVAPFAAIAAAVALLIGWIATARFESLPREGAHHV